MTQFLVKSSKIELFDSKLSQKVQSGGAVENGVFHDFWRIFAVAQHLFCDRAAVSSREHTICVVETRRKAVRSFVGINYKKHGKNADFTIFIKIELYFKFKFLRFSSIFKNRRYIASFLF